MKYPTRCEIIDVSGSTMLSMVGEIYLKTPKESKPHIGKQGLAEEIEVDQITHVKITLDDNTILWGYECWWKPV